MSMRRYGLLIIGAAVVCMMLSSQLLGAEFVFTASRRVDHGTGDAYKPVVGANSTHVIFTVWEDYRNSNYDVYCAYSADNGSTFSGDYRINDLAGSQSEPDFAVAGDLLHVVWTDDRDGAYRIYYANTTNCSSVGTNHRVTDTSTGNKVMPAVAARGSHVYVVWTDTRNINQDIYFAASNDSGGTFGTNVKVNDDPSSAIQRYPDIAVDSNGVIHVVWEDSRNGNYDIYYSKSTDGGATFSSNLRVNSQSSGNQTSPSVSIGPDNSIHVVWTDDSSPQAQSTSTMPGPQTAVQASHPLLGWTTAAQGTRTTLTCLRTATERCMWCGATRGAEHTSTMPTGQAQASHRT